MRKFPFNQSVLYIAITKTRLGQPQWDICVGSASSPRPAGWKNSMAPWFLWLAERSSNSQRGIILYASNILKSDHTESYRKGASANPKPSWFMFNPLGLKSDGEFPKILFLAPWIQCRPAVLAPTLYGPEERIVALWVLLFHLGPGAQQILPKMRTTNKGSTCTAKLCQVY